MIDTSHFTNAVQLHILESAIMEFNNHSFIILINRFTARQNKV